MTQTQAAALRTTIAKAVIAAGTHLLLAFSLMIVTFYAINRVNDAMGFLTARISVWFQMIYLLLGFALSLDSFLRNHVRMFALPVLALCMVLLVPSVMTVFSEADEIAANFVYQTALLGCAGLLFAFAIRLIVFQRRATRAIYRAAGNNEASTEQPVATATNE